MTGGLHGFPLFQGGIADAVMPTDVSMHIFPCDWHKKHGLSVKLS
jgi:hypothetical protein